MPDPAVAVVKGLVWFVVVTTFFAVGKFCLALSFLRLASLFIMEEKERGTFRDGIKTQTIPIRTGSIQSNSRTLEIFLLTRMVSLS